MYLSIHIKSIGSFTGSILILVFAVYSLIYMNSFKNHRIVADFFTMQISLFIFLFSNAFYMSVTNPIYVLIWTKACYFGGTSAIVTIYRFTETITEKRNVLLCRLHEIFTTILLIAIIMPGNHFFTNVLNPVKSYNTVIKGPMFAILILAILIPIAVSLTRLSMYIFSDKKRRKIGNPILIGLIAWFLSTAFDGIFSAVLSITQPQLWLGPTIMAFSTAFFTTKMAEHRHNEMERVKTEKEEIYRNVIHDKVSGVYSREYIFESISQRASLKNRNNRIDSLLFIDIDNFKLLNDQLGHKTGDEVLALLGNVLKKNTRAGDIAARQGGDEFLVLLDNCDINYAPVVAGHIQSLFNKNLKDKLEKWPFVQKVSLSIGIVSNNDWGDDVEEIIHKADLAMYVSKKSGKNKISLYNDGINYDEKSPHRN